MTSARAWSRSCSTARVQGRRPRCGCEHRAFVAAAKEHDADFVAMSSLMVTTMPKMKVVIEALREAGVEAKPIIGGAP